MGIFDSLRRKTRHKAVFLGLDNSGKSTIISFLQSGKFVEHAPTMGKKLSEMDIGGTRISLYDMGGQKDFRDLWMGEARTAKCIVFVVDRAAPERFVEARAELDKVLQTINWDKRQLLLLANKSDVPTAVPMGKLISDLGLTDLDNFEIMEISARTGYGMADAFAKFYTMLTGQQVKKNKLTKGISVFNGGGVPIVSQFDTTTDEIEKKAIEGGFLVAITQFTRLKMDASDETNIISFESEGSGTFLVAKSQHYIASLLWTNDLGIPIEQSKTALLDLLDHLEITCIHEDVNNVAFIVEQYITNLL
jgi:GTP-binding protein SAR1